MNDIDLKSCPFCGGNSEWEEWYAFGCDAFQVKCKECLSTSAVRVIKEKNKVANLWNKRIYDNFFEEIKHHADNGHENLSISWLLDQIKNIQG